MSDPSLQMPDEAVEMAMMAALDALTESWVAEVGWRDQLEQLAHTSLSFAGPRLLGPGGPALKMLVLRQRNLIDRWVRQAYLEGLIAGRAIGEDEAEHDG